MEVVETIVKSPFPTILGIGGVIFLFLALIGRVGGKVIIDIPPDRQKGFAITGIALLLAGAFLYVLPFLIAPKPPIPTPTAVAQVIPIMTPTTTNTPSATPSPTLTATTADTPTTLPTSTPPPLPPTSTTPVPPAPTHIPSPTIIQPTATIGPSFGEMSFCLKDGFNEAARRCETSRTTFTGQVERLYVSWTYSNVYVGMIFSRKWYRNNQLIPLPQAENDIWDGDNWKTDGVSEYTWLDAEIFGQRYFPPGSYVVELYIGASLEQSGSFTVE